MSHSCADALERWFDDVWPVRSWCDSHVVLAVSGGPDSVAMLRAAVALKESAVGEGRLYVAHLNHRLRGAESDADQAWLEKLCRRLNLQLEVAAIDVAAIASEKGNGWEAAARDARYNFLRLTAERLGARFVAVGHTADDQVETVLHRVLRGTGLVGLAGMPFTRPLSPSASLVRPLLGMRRCDVLAYLAAIGQDFRTDASNVDPRWTRNRLRHELLPLLRAQYNREVEAALLRLAGQAGEAQTLVSELAAGLACECSAGRVQIDCDQLRGRSPLVVRELLRIAWGRANWPQQAMGFDEWQQLADLALSDGELPPINLPGNVRAHREGHVLILEKPGPH